MEEKLRSGLRALGLPEDAAPVMALHGRLLAERGQVMNLTAIRDEEEMVTSHFLDSCALLPLFDFRNRSVVDVGSGAGFPGFPLRMVEPSIRLTLLDAQRKRVAFLKEVCVVAGLEDVSCVHERAEVFALSRRETFDVAVSRAVAALPLLLELCLPLVKPGGHCLAMKSVNSGQELKEAERALSLLGGAVERTEDYRIPGTEITHRLLVLKKIRNTPPGYPRAFARMKKHPL